MVKRKDRRRTAPSISSPTPYPLLSKSSTGQPPRPGINNNNDIPTYPQEGEGGKPDTCEDFSSTTYSERLGNSWRQPRPADRISTPLSISCIGGAGEAPVSLVHNESFGFLFIRQTVGLAHPTVLAACVLTRIASPITLHRSSPLSFNPRPGAGTRASGIPSFSLSFSFSFACTTDKCARWRTSSPLNLMHPCRHQRKRPAITRPLAGAGERAERNQGPSHPSTGIFSGKCHARCIYGGSIPDRDPSNSRGVKGLGNAWGVRRGVGVFHGPGWGAGVFLDPRA